MTEECMNNNPDSKALSISELEKVGGQISVRTEPPSSPGADPTIITERRRWVWKQYEDDDSFLVAAKGKVSSSSSLSTGTQQQQPLQQSMRFNLSCSEDVLTICPALRNTIALSVFHIFNLPSKAAMSLLDKQTVGITDEEIERVPSFAMSRAFTDPTYSQELSQLEDNGLMFWFELTERKPCKKWTTLIIASIAASELLIGALLITVGPLTVFSMGVGIGFIIEAATDLYAIAKLGITNSHEWKSYCWGKVFSMGLIFF